MIRTRRFSDRYEAGRELAPALESHRDSDAIVLGLARGGVPVAFEVALELALAMDVFVVRKLGLPQQPELAMGAVGSGGVCVLNDDVLRHQDVQRAVLDRVVAAETAELLRQERLFRAGREALPAAGKAVILIDDGVATGSSIRVAISALRARGAGELTVAVPVGPQETCATLAGEVDELACLLRPDPFLSVGTWYEDFGQTSDEEVRDLLVRATDR